MYGQCTVCVDYLQTLLKQVCVEHVLCVDYVLTLLRQLDIGLPDKRLFATAEVMTEHIMAVKVSTMPQPYSITKNEESK